VLFTPRKPIRLPHKRYIGRNIYFLTICAENRRRPSPSRSKRNPDVSEALTSA
jgi:hypothetical protein